MRCAGLFLLLAITLQVTSQEKPWTLHTIDNSSRGADGVRLMDVNGDGLLDITTGWEEGGQVRICLNPGPKKAKEPWPSVTVGKVKSPEDAVFVDVDQDGNVDIVSCCEGKTKSVFVHWAPKKREDYLNAEQWKTESFPALANLSAWMYCLPMQVDGKHGIDLVIGAKGNAKTQIGWLESPSDPRSLKDWKWHPINPVGWVMSIRASDIDQDGDADVVISDRKGALRGCRWLENPGPGKAQSLPWKSHDIGAMNEEVMFLDLADPDGDGLEDVIVPTYQRKLYILKRTKNPVPTWETITLPYPEVSGTGKGARVGDLDRDGKPDLVLTGRCPKDKHGIVWLQGEGANWKWLPVSGPATKKSYKPDRIEFVDLDGDGDLDVITSEEQSGLGVIWYENPEVSPK